MSVENTNEDLLAEANRYEPPKLTRFGTIEEWTQGVLGGVSISIVV